MFNYKFTYNSPEFGEIEVQGPKMEVEDVIKEIERMYPEAIDIQVISIEEVV